MAGLTTTTPNAKEHFAAIAQLRWRLFVNAFKRKGGKGEVIARLIAFPIIALWSIGPIIAFGAGGYYLTSHGKWGSLATLLWALSAIWVFISFSALMSASALQGSTFDLSQLIRFPISFPSYLITRIFFSFFTYTTVIGFLCLIAISIGIGIAHPRLFPWAAIDLFFFGFTILFFLRAIFLWMDRWLAQRRTREIVLAFFIAFSLGIQVISLTIQRHPHGTRTHTSAILTIVQHFAPHLKPFTTYLPPTLAANSIQQMHSGAPLPAIAALIALTIFGIAFLALYAHRLRGEFRGENFNESAARPTKTSTAATGQSWSLFGLPPTIAACLEKEIRYLLRGGAALMNLITPVIFVAIFIGRMTYISKSLILATALAYVVFGLFAALYNTLGADAAGVHLYLLAPIRLRDVFIAKNIVSVAVITTEILLTTLIVSIAHRPTLPIATATLLWAAFAILVNLSVGNLRSIYAPRRAQLIKGAPAQRPTSSRSGGLISLGVLFGSLILCMAILWPCDHYGHPWLAVLVFLALAIAAFVAYTIVLSRIDQIALDHRDTLAENLCKA